MILEYKFEYQSNNNTFETYIDNILKQKDIEYKIFRDNSFIYLYLEDDESELLKVSDELSKELPNSIFLKNFALEVVSQVPKKDYIYTPVKYKKSFCHKCFAMTLNKEESTNYYNPFTDCDICGATSNVKQIVLLENGKELSYKNYEQLFETLALRISEGKKIKLETSRGELILSKLENVDGENALLCCDINSLNNLVVGSKEKTVLLSSIEKPSLDFNINAIYKKNKNIQKEKINVVCPFDLTLEFLSQKLRDYEIDFLSIKRNGTFDYELVFDGFEKQNQISKIAFINNQVLILESNDYKKELDEVFTNFKEKSKAQFMVNLEENNLHSKSIVNLFTSSTSSDNIAFYSKEIDGMLNILDYKLPKSINEVFEKIEKSETGKRLLENYKEKFPSNYQALIEFDLSSLKSNSISSLWKLASVLLGLEDILETANNALMQKGPRIDYQLKESDKIFNREFQLEKLFQSGMSFKLAGVDDKTLALGYVESFVEFLSKIVDDVNATFSLDGVSICGNMASNELFNKLINKSIAKNYKLFYNKEFPIEV